MAKENTFTETEPQKEKALAVSVVKKGSDRDVAQEHLDELEFLAETAGAEVIEKIYQELQVPNKATVVGKGKLEEILLEVTENDIDLVIFDDDLSPAQTRNLESKLKIKVIDRSGLILDIFAQRARSNEAKTQVELAQLQYMLPKLTRMWTHLSKQYGGIGTKGPGETQIETDRRIIRTRIQRLKDKLADIDTNKAQQRKGREQMPQFALVGYTNAGKSTLMNAITEADVYIQDQLFATLDTTVRTFKLPNGRKSLLSDTVGFIRKLPHHLVASFRSTLSEAREADILLHVVDVTHPQFRDQLAVVEKTLRSLNIADKPTILVFNKIDMLEEMDMLKVIEDEFPKSIFISSTRGNNINKLLDMMQDMYDSQHQRFFVKLPYDKMSMLAELYQCGEIFAQKDKDDGSIYEIGVFKDKKEIFANKFEEFILKDYEDEDDG